MKRAEPKEGLLGRLRALFSMRPALVRSETVLFVRRHPLTALLLVLVAVGAWALVASAGASAPRAEAPALGGPGLPEHLPGLPLAGVVPGGIQTDPESSPDAASELPFVLVLADAAKTLRPLNQVSADGNGASTQDAGASVPSGPATNGQLTVPDLRRNTALTGTSVLVDPGHGSVGSPGVKGPSGVEEADVVLDVSKRLAQLLRNAGARVDMTRENAFGRLNNKERAELANRLRVDVFLRIHAETYPDVSTSGVEALWAKDDSKFLAKTVVEELASGTGLVSLGANKVTGYEGLMASNVPAAQVSIGALSNSSNEQFLAAESNRQRVAEALYSGIVKYIHAR